MRVQAITRNVRMSAQKMREVVRQIQGLPAQRAKAVLAVVPRKSARFVAKTLDSDRSRPATSAALDGAASPVAWPPGKWAASSRKDARTSGSRRIAMPRELY